MYNRNNQVIEFLKEDGSLDVERFSKLPLEEKTEVMGSFTREQMKEYISKLPNKESCGPVKVIKVNYKMEDMLARGCATYEQIMNKIRRHVKVNFEEEESSITEELLKNESILEESANWTADQWIEFYSKDGVMTLEEFDQFNKSIIERLFPKEI